MNIFEFIKTFPEWVQNIIVLVPILCIPFLLGDLRTLLKKKIKFGKSGLSIESEKKRRHTDK